MPQTLNIPGYNPDQKLFSKCARDHAARRSRKKTVNLEMRNNKSSIISFCQTKKPKKTVASFDMNESREQREKKFHQTVTPAVGQYNPKLCGGGAKLTWNVLKVYNKSRIGREGRRKEQKKKDAGEKMLQNDGVEVSQGMMTEFSQILAKSPENPKNKNENGKSKNQNKDKKYQTRNKTEKSQRQHSKKFNTIKSQVDMSRITGRKQERYNQFNNSSQLDMDMSRSIQYIKPYTSKKISFQHQISRERANELMVKPLVIAADYSFDYSKFKPNKSAFIDFEKTVGRKKTIQSTIEPPYSYIHYDYNAYVWNGKSNIFSNTKNNMVNFKKQTFRKTLRQ